MSFLLPPSLIFMAACNFIIFNGILLSNVNIKLSCRMGRSQAGGWKVRQRSRVSDAPLPLILSFSSSYSSSPFWLWCVARRLTRSRRGIGIIVFFELLCGLGALKLLWGRGALELLWGFGIFAFD